MTLLCRGRTAEPQGLLLVALSRLRGPAGAAGRVSGWSQFLFESPPPQDQTPPTRTHSPAPFFGLHNGSTQGTKLVTELVSRMLRLAIFCLICKFALLMKRIAGWRPGYQMKPFFPLFFSCSNRPLSGCNATNDPSDQNSSHSQRERRQNTNLKESLASNKNVSSAEVRVRADGENIFQKIVKNPQKFFKLIKLIELSLRIFFGLF